MALGVVSQRPCPKRWLPCGFEECCILASSRDSGLANSEDTFSHEKMSLLGLALERKTRPLRSAELPFWLTDVRRQCSSIQR